MASDTQLDTTQLAERLSNAINELHENQVAQKELMHAFTSFQQSTLVELAKLQTAGCQRDAKLAELDRKTTDNEKLLIELGKAIQPLVLVNKILAVIGSTLLMTMLGLVWALITHQITITTAP